MAAFAREIIRMLSIKSRKRNRQMAHCRYTLTRNGAGVRLIADRWARLERRRPVSLSAHSVHILQPNSSSSVLICFPWD